MCESLGFSLRETSPAYVDGTAIVPCATEPEWSDLQKATLHQHRYVLFVAALSNEHYLSHDLLVLLQERKRDGFTKSGC